MRLPKIRSRSEFEALFEAIDGAALSPANGYETLFDPKNFSFCIVPQGVFLEHRL
jgi:hypothetical protein